MPSQLERPKTPPPPRRRGILSENEDVRSAQVGAMLTVVVWLLLVYLFALALRHLGHTPTPGPSTAAKPTFNIELTPEEFPMPQKAPPLPDKFVETNPDAPENTPDKTRNVAARNQQVAQEKPDLEGKSDTPKLEGKKEGEVSQIVSGQLHEPELPPPAPPPPPTQPAPQAAEQTNARKEQNPLPGEEKIVGDNPEGFGTALSKEQQNPTDVPEKVTGQKESPFMIGAPQATVPKVDPQRPLPRPRVDRNVRPAVLVQNKFGTSNIGPTAIDARWSQYAEYIQKLIETVQVQWERILENSHVSPPSGTEVKIRFRLDGAEGAVTEIIESKSTGGTQAERACQSAITARSPYGKWTDDMIAVLGQSQEMTFTFYYQ
ncbi:MAG TPA: hypothetical protein VFT72_15645 [Opitutaceae bacterium]|nr:hypothetical protein [Opitutaceae bacterium]